MMAGAPTEAAAARLDGFALLTEMVRIPSVSMQEHQLGVWLLDHLPALGFRVSRDGAGNVIVERGTGPSEVLFLGHMDTVPGAIPVREENGRLFGRGSVDAKGPLAAAITAAARHPLSATHRTTIIAAVEEEGSSRGARYLLSRPAPDHLIVLEPSGWDAVTLGYKGSLFIRFRLTKAVAHGAGPSGSAADHAIAFIRRLQDHAAQLSQDRGIFDRVDVRVIGMDAAHDGLRDVATATIGMRLPLQFDIDAFGTALQEWRGEAEIAIDHADAAVRAEKNTPLVRAFLAGIRSTGGTPRFKNKTGTSDMNILLPLWKCPAVAYGPGDSSLDHTPQEAIERNEFERGVAVLSAVLATLVPA